MWIFKQRHGGLKTRSWTFQTLGYKIFKQGFELFKPKKIFETKSMESSVESVGSKIWWQITKEWEKGLNTSD